MITEHELLVAIDECQNALPSTFSTCEKLAVFYTILDHLRAKNSSVPMMSADAESKPFAEIVIGNHGNTDFFSAVRGKDASKVWLILGELMDALLVLNPKLYSRTMERIISMK